MAPPNSKHQEIQRLIRQSEESRTLLAAHANVIRQRLDIPTRLRHSLTEKPTHWLLGGLASGLAASLLLRRKPSKPKITQNRSLPLTLLGITFTAARPLLQAFLTTQIKNYLAAKPSTSPFTITPQKTAPHSSTP